MRCIRKTRSLTHTKSINASNVKSSTTVQKTEKNQVCAKCGGNHRLVECTANVEKCVNCERKGHSDLNHQTNGTNCPVYKEEVSRIKNRTDHGC